MRDRPTLRHALAAARCERAGHVIPDNDDPIRMCDCGARSHVNGPVEHLTRDRLLMLSDYAALRSDSCPPVQRETWAAVAFTLARLATCYPPQESR